MSSRVYSTTIETLDTNAELERQFDISGVGETIDIVDETLTTELACEDRAKSIFLKQSYVHTNIEVTLYHQPNLQIGMVVDVDGILYKIVGLIASVGTIANETTIKAKRWDR